MPLNIPQVGIGVVIIKNNQVLLGQRKNAHGEGAWGFPGGHLEFNESWEDCAMRETAEETGVTITNIRFGTATNDIFPTEQKHYITIFMIADWKSGEPQIMEPDKCAQWKWFAWEQLPQPLFMPIQNLLKQNFKPL